MPPLNTIPFNLLLADDDPDDCDFFKDALEDLPLTVHLTTVNDGFQLMNYLMSGPNQMPDILFLDLNMPRKSGLECLSEIKMNDGLKQLPVIIFSTSFDMQVVDLLYKNGAHYYIRKPGDYAKLKQVILSAITLIVQNDFKHPTKDNFIIPT